MANTCSFFPERDHESTGVGTEEGEQEFQADSTMRLHHENRAIPVAPSHDTQVMT